MASPDPDLLEVQRELVERFAFYDTAAKAELIIRTGETRIYGNALVRKGVVPSTGEWA